MRLEAQRAGSSASGRGDDVEPAADAEAPGLWAVGAGDRDGGGLASGDGGPGSAGLAASRAVHDRRRKAPRGAAPRGQLGGEARSVGPLAGAAARARPSELGHRRPGPQVGQPGCVAHSGARRVQGSMVASIGEAAAVEEPAVDRGPGRSAVIGMCWRLEIEASLFRLGQVRDDGTPADPHPARTGGGRRRFVDGAAS